MGSQYPGSNVYPSDYTIPDDGDTLDVASVNVALEALGDRTEWLRQTGRGILQMVGLQVVSHDLATFTSTGTTTLTILSGTNITDVIALLSTANTPTDYELPVTPEVGDIVEILVTGYQNTTSAASHITDTSFRLEDSQNGNSYISVATGGVSVPTLVNDPNLNTLVTGRTYAVQGFRSITVAGVYALRLHVDFTGANAATIQTAIAVTMKVWRNVQP